LVANGPLKAIQAFNNQNVTHKLSTYGALFEENMSSVVKQIATVDIKLSSHSNHIWGLTGMVLATLTLTTLVVLVLYRFSSRFRSKIQNLRERLTELTQQLLNLEINYGSNRGPPPPVPPKSVDMLLRRFRHLKRRVPTDQADPQSTYLNLSTDELSTHTRGGEERMYQSTSAFTPLSPVNPPRFYPRLTPMKQLSNLELQDLDEDSKEVERLCSTKPTNL